MFSVLLVYQCCAIYQRRRRRRRRGTYPPEPPIVHHQQDFRRGPVRVVEKEGVLVLQPDGSTCAVACVEERPAAASLDPGAHVYQVNLGPRPGSPPTPRQQPCLRPAPPLDRHLARHAGLGQQDPIPAWDGTVLAEVGTPACGSDGGAPCGGLRQTRYAPSPQATGSPLQGGPQLLPPGGRGSQPGPSQGPQLPAAPTAAQQLHQQEQPDPADAVAAPLGPLQAGLAPAPPCLSAQGPLEACQSGSAPPGGAAVGAAEAACVKGR
ncbi:hypothetical protein N2152v2_009182 [Parachlorella kessleri]